jgi:hypothetical protein
MFEARMAADSTPVWAVSQPLDNVQALTVDQSGNVYATGYAVVDTTVGTFAISRGLYLLKLNKNGTLQWARSVGDDVPVPMHQIPKVYFEGTSLAIALDGDIIIASRFQASVDFSGNGLDGGVDGGVFQPPASGGAFVAKLNSADGTGSTAMYGTRWAQILDGIDSQALMLTGVDAKGNIYLGTTFAGTAHIGSYPVTTSGADAILLASFQPMGGGGVGLVVDCTAQVTLNSLATSPFGAVVIGGQTLGTLSSTSFTGTLAPSSSMGDGFVAMFNQGWSYAWGKTFGTNSQTYGVGLDMNGNARLVGWFTGTLDLGAGQISAGANKMLLLAEMANADGTVKWNRGWPDPGITMYLAVAPAGDAFVGGTLYGGPVDFGTGMLIQASDPSQAWAGRFAP